MKVSVLLTIPVIALAFLTTGCLPDPPTPEPKVVKPPFYFGGDVNATEITFGEGVNDYTSVTGYSSSGVSGGDAFFYHKSSWFIQSNELVAFLKDGNDYKPKSGFISFDFVLNTDYELSKGSINALVYPKRYFYSEEKNGGLTSGVIVKFRDNTGKEWSTLLGAQFDSNFEVMKTKELPRLTDEFLTTYKVFNARINCALYDKDGNFILMEDAFTRSLVRNI